MALISTKNILIPFTNKLHLTTIILVVIAFTIFRLSGGRIDAQKVSGNDSKSSSYQSEETGESQKFNSGFGKAAKSETPAKREPKGSGRPSLDDIEQMF